MFELSFHQLAVFRAVARAASFRVAAERLCLSQPAVSHQVKALERALAVRLTVRHGRGFRLTPAGERVAEYAERVAHLGATLQQELAAMSGQLSGQVRVGAAGTAGEYLLPAALGRFRTLYPGVAIRVEITNSAAIQDRILAELLEVGLIGEPVARSGLAATRFGTDRIILVASPDHPLAARRLAPDILGEHPYVAREPGSATRAAAEAAFAAAGLAPRPVLELGSNDALKRAAASQVGFAALSDLAVAPELAAGWLVELDAPWFACALPLLIVQRAGWPAPPAVTALTEFLLAGSTPPQRISHGLTRGPAAATPGDHPPR